MASLLIVAIVILSSLLSRSYLKITVDPPVAEVTVNNKVIGLDSRGFAQAKVPPGDAIIKVAADGYIGFSQKVTFNRGRSSAYQVSLHKNPTEFKISDSDAASNNVQFISGADEQNAIFYLANSSSTLYKTKFAVDDAGNISTVFNNSISNPPLSGIKNIIWSPKRDAAIFKKDSGVYTFFDFKKYNFVSQSEVKYGDNIGDLAWSPDDSKIAYYYAPPSGEKSLIFADNTNTNINRVANLTDAGIDNPYLAWSPDSEWLIVIPRNKDITQNKIYLFNAYTRSFATANNSGSNIEAMFTPDSQKIIYSASSDDPANPVKQMVSIMDKNGDNKQSLNLRAYISKISFFNTDQNKIAVATYDTDSRTESIFVYDVSAKAKAGFEIDLPAKAYVKEMTVDQQDEILYYIANDKFYVLALKN